MRRRKKKKIHEEKNPRRKKSYDCQYYIDQDSNESTGSRLTFTLRMRQGGLFLMFNTNEENTVVFFSLVYLVQFMYLKLYDLDRNDRQYFRFDIDDIQSR